MLTPLVVVIPLSLAMRIEEPTPPLCEDVRGRYTVVVVDNNNEVVDTVIIVNIRYSLETNEVFIVPDLLAKIYCNGLE